MTYTNKQVKRIAKAVRYLERNAKALAQLDKLHTELMERFEGQRAPYRPRNATGFDLTPKQDDLVIALDEAGLSVVVEHIEWAVKQFDIAARAYPTAVRQLAKWKAKGKVRA